MIDNNPVFYTPIRDDHAVEVMLAGLFLSIIGRTAELGNWIDQITLSSIFTHRRGGMYPCIFREYAELADHPQYTEEYKKDATVGSILYPTLAVWLAILDKTETFEYLARFQIQDMAHSTWQLWLPDAITDVHLYKNSATHGASFVGLNLEPGRQALVEQIENEVSLSTAFGSLSAMKFAMWPLVLMACRSYRLPVPPHFWMFQPQMKAAPANSPPDL